MDFLFSTVIRYCRQALLVAAVLIMTGPAQAESSFTVHSQPTRTAVLELYTSEGCSSCPPADQWLTQLVQLPQSELDVLALAFHVDYWDYIGWKDRFANPAYSNRQRHLARINQQDSVYTPEFFVNGSEMRGTRRIIEKLQTINQIPSSIELSLTIQPRNQAIELELDNQSSLQSPLLVRFVVFEDQLASDVKHGENAGRKLNHERVVRHFSSPQTLAPRQHYRIEIPADWNLRQLGVGALVESPDGEYLQAVYSKLERQK